MESSDGESFGEKHVAVGDGVVSGCGDSDGDVESIEKVVVCCCCCSQPEIEKRSIKLAVSSKVLVLDPGVIMTCCSCSGGSQLLKSNTQGRLP